MKKKILFSAPSKSPGPLTAFRNHKALLGSFFDVDIVLLEELISPPFLKDFRHQSLYYRICKRLKLPVIDQILPYGENVIFGTFAPIHEKIVEKLNKKGIRPSFMWCSSLGQIEMTLSERKPFSRLIELLRAGKVKYLFLHRRLYNSIGFFVKEAIFLPHSIDLTIYKNVSKANLPGINLDLFCRPRLGKNILNQITGFEMAGIDGVLHINFDPAQFQGIIEKISQRVIRHKWLSQEEYFSLVAGMTLSLQVTIGESFNYAVCERMCLGVPVLTTRDIYLVAEDEFLIKYLCIEAPDTPAEIARAMKNIVLNKNLRQELAEGCKKRIAQVAEQNNKIVLEQFLHYFG
uniref:Glycosyltransferase family 1 protein n=1 Tax=candidate division WOR-3 bacterium TaxID=2052148 RepID=A0A7V0Z6W3_UNCW3